MILFTYIIIILTVSLISWQFIYFRRQKKSCMKYPYYKYRDEVILQIVDRKKHDADLSEIYDNANHVIENLNKLNLSIIQESLSHTFKELLEHGHKHNFKDVPNLDSLDIPNKELKSKFGKLIVSTAKQNSIVVRFALSRFGYRVLLLTSAIGGLIKFHRNHPEIIQKIREDIQIAKELHYIDNSNLVA